MKKFSPIILAVTFLGLVWSLYYSQFGGNFSKDTGTWGAFGDYTGGIVNPLFNFITIYLLIKSLNFQERQIEIAKSEADQARNDLDAARKNESLRSYESSLLAFSKAALEEFKLLSVTAPNSNTLPLKSGAAVSYLQNELLSKERTKEEFEKFVNHVDEYNHECIYSVVRSFSALFKLTLDLCPQEEQPRYMDMISLIIPTKAQYLLFMMEAFSSWKILDHPRNLGFFERETNKDTLKRMRSLIKPPKPNP